MSSSSIENHRSADQQKLADVWQVLHAVISGEDDQEAIEPRALPTKLTQLAGDFGFSEAQKKAIAKFIAKKRLHPGFKPEDLNDSWFFAGMKDYLLEANISFADDSKNLEAYIRSSRAVVGQVFNPTAAPAPTPAQRREALIACISEVDLDPNLARYWRNYLTNLTPESLLDSFPTRDEFLKRSDQMLSRVAQRREEVTQVTARTVARQRADTKPPRSVTDREVTKKVKITELSKEVKGLLSQVDKKLKADKFADAIELSRKAMKIDERASFKIRACYEEMIKTEEGADVLHSLVISTPEAAQARLYYGRYLHQRVKTEEDLKKAIEYYEQAISIDPKLLREVEKLFLRSAEERWKSGRHLEAIGDIKRAITLNPSSTRAWEILRDRYEWFKEIIEGGREVLLNIVRVEPQDALAHCILGEIYFKHNATEEGMKHFNHAHELDPSLSIRMAPIIKAKLTQERADLKALKKSKKKKATAARIKAKNDSIQALQDLGSNVVKIIFPDVPEPDTEPSEPAELPEPPPSVINSQNVIDLNAPERNQIEGGSPLIIVSPEVLDASIPNQDADASDEGVFADEEGQLAEPEEEFDEPTDPIKKLPVSGESDDDLRDDPDPLGAVPAPGDEGWDELTDPSADIYPDAEEIEFIESFGDLRAYRRIVNMPGFGLEPVYNLKKANGEWVSRYWMTDCGYIKSIDKMKVDLLIDDYEEKKKRINEGEAIQLPPNPDSQKAYLLDQEGRLLGDGFMHIDRFCDKRALAWTGVGQTYIKDDGDYLVYHKGKEYREELPGGSFRYKPFIFDEAWAFSEGRGRVLVGDKFRFVTTEGDFLDGEFDNAEDFKNGLANVKMGDEWQVIDRLGVLLPPYETDVTQPGVPNPLLDQTFDEGTLPGEVPVPPDQPPKWSGPIPVPGSPGWPEYQMVQSLITGEAKGNADPEDEEDGMMPAPWDAPNTAEDFGEETPIVTMGTLREIREKLMPVMNQDQAKQRMQLLYGIFGDSVGFVPGEGELDKVLESIEEYRQLIEQFPEADFNHRAMAKLLRELMEEGKLTIREVKIAHEQDVRSDRHNWEPWYEVALTFFGSDNEENLDEAKKYFEKAKGLTKDPKVIFTIENYLHKIMGAWITLGESYLDSDDLDNVKRANELFAKAFEFAKRHEDRKKIKRYLQKIVPEKIGELLEATRNED